NLALAAGKLAGGVLGHSQALVADAVESLADIVSSVIVWRGLVVAARPPDDDHPYGHGKAESIATAIIATLLLMAAVGIGVSATREIFQPHQPPHPWTLAVLLGVVVIKESLFRIVARAGRETGSSAVSSDAWHHRSDAITSFAAAIGITAAWIGGPSWAAADDVAAVFAAGIIGWNGWRLLRPALLDLMDTTPDPAITAEIRRLAESVAGVTNVEKVLVRRMGWELLADMHVRVAPEMTVAAAHVIAHRVKDRIRNARPAVRDVLIHIEPDRGPRGISESPSDPGIS
ncbi:MAG: cation transporter, partial [Verrucomicrobiales bacterium]|nr:cation transporter [Verrucomicrobiales bacterium]